VESGGKKKGACVMCVTDKRHRTYKQDLGIGYVLRKINPTLAKLYVYYLYSFSLFKKFYFFIYSRFLNYVIPFYFFIVLCFQFILLCSLFINNILFFNNLREWITRDVINLLGTLKCGLRNVCLKCIKFNNGIKKLLYLLLHAQSHQW